ncbi:MAG: hypothetical protein ABIP75_05425 [Pyrinomonadaceae bacterium]
MTRTHISLFSYVIAIVCFVGFPSTAQACSCASDDSVRDAFGGASAVFVGEVVGSLEQKTLTDTAGQTTTYDVGEIYFSVQEVFSGVEGRKKVTIHSGTGGGDCGYWFQRNTRYLIYAYGEPNKRLSTNICTRTRPLDEATDDLTVLRQLPVKGSGVIIAGRVTEAGPRGIDNMSQQTWGLANIPVTITRKQGKPIRLKTDGDGRYEVTGLRPGEYTVAVVLPPQYLQTDFLVKTVKVHDRGSAHNSFYAMPDNRVSGQIVDLEGKPVPKAKLVLVNSKRVGPLTIFDEMGTEYGDDPNGKFEFTEIPPGEYLLGYNLTDSPDQEQPYPQTYYPGVQDRTQATVIKLGVGDQRKDLVFRLPAKLRERTIEGTVLWPNGEAAGGIEVYLVDSTRPDRGVARASTDDAGHFSLVGYEGLSYWVWAGIDVPKPVHAEPHWIKDEGDVAGLRLVVTAEGNSFWTYFEEKK